MSFCISFKIKKYFSIFFNFTCEAKKSVLHKHLVSFSLIRKNNGFTIRHARTNMITHGNHSASHTHLLLAQGNVGACDLLVSFPVLGMGLSALVYFVEESFVSLFESRLECCATSKHISTRKLQ